MSHQGNIWDREYKNPKLVTGGDEPLADTLRFLKFLKKEQKYKAEDRVVLDLGCGTGRNSNYLVDLGNKVVGIEISKTALNIAQGRAREMGLQVDYRLGDIGRPYEIPDNSVDIILDVTSSNSLDEQGRDVYLNEMNRVLKGHGSASKQDGPASTQDGPASTSTQGGYIFVRALCKDGNKNVKNLLKTSHGKEYDTYIMKEIGLTERVFSREDFIKTYSKYFKILKLEKKTGYSTFNSRIYKRDYWLAYLQK